MLQKMLRLPAAQAVFAPEEELAIPAWAKGAVGALESAGFRSAVMEAMKACTERSRALGK